MRRRLRSAEPHLGELALAEDARTDRVASSGDPAVHGGVHESHAREVGGRLRPVALLRSRTEAAPDVAELVEHGRHELGHREPPVPVDRVHRDRPRGDPAAARVLRERGGAVRPIELHVDVAIGTQCELPSTSCRRRGQLALRTDGDIDVELDGTNGTSALTQHSSGGRVTSRTIAVHTIDGNRRLTVAELMATVLHELGHIWCCFGPGTKEGHWAETPTDFSSVGLMYSPMNCRVTRGSDPICPSVFSERELAEMRLSGP